MQSWGAGGRGPWGRMGHVPTTARACARQCPGQGLAEGRGDCTAREQAPALFTKWARAVRIIKGFSEPLAGTWGRRELKMAPWEFAGRL